MKTIEYSPNGIAFGDHEVETKARVFLHSNLDHINVSTEMFVLSVRALIFEKEIVHSEVQFLFDGRYLQPDENGRLAEWPIGFGDTAEKLLWRLLPIKKNKS